MSLLDGEMRIHFSVDSDKDIKLFGTNGYTAHSKPDGLWYSIEGQESHGWRAWCKGEHFRMDSFKAAWKIEFKDELEVLQLDTYSLLSFTNQYASNTEDYLNRNDFIHGINWDEVAKDFKAIEITPYAWEHRLTSQCAWYYGWDCASGCVWDVSCIESFKRIPMSLVPLYKEDD